MRIYFCVLFSGFLFIKMKGQEKPVNLKELGVPNSPAFVIADVSPTVVQSPTTPKEFIFGLGQTFSQSQNGFPQNYSLEFTPYWWFNARGRDIYDFFGLRIHEGSQPAPSASKQDPFHSLKFVNFSLAFLNEDLVPDSSDLDQKIFSIGLRTTVVKINQRGWETKLVNKLQQWHDEVISEIDIARAKIELEPDSAKREKMRQDYEKKSVFPSTNTQKEIIDLINQKPILSWDVAAAGATYGIGDSVWRTGRFGVWTTVSSYIPLALDEEEGRPNYLSLNLFFRYLNDKYTLNKENHLVKANNIDFGGKAGFEFRKLSIGVEALHRFQNKKADAQNRTIGYISYQVGDNFYINGAYGKNFGPANKLVSMIGINWGIGNEKIALPD